MNADDWILTWSDEFDGPEGAPPDPKHWNHDIGGHGWGNNELQSYTNRRENARLEGGCLAIHAIRERYTGPDGIACEYTSARLTTLGHFAQAFGRFEARIKIPHGQGSWPAFWMLGADIAINPWPRCGEIDVMEVLGRRPETVHGTVHGPGFSGSQGITNTHTLGDARRYADDFHIYAVEWDRDAIHFWVDDINYATLDPGNFPDHGGQYFRHPFFVVLNLAVGGNWPGPPDTSTPTRMTMLIDYVRVYRHARGASE